MESLNKDQIKQKDDDEVSLYSSKGESAKTVSRKTSMSNSSSSSVSSD